MVVEPEISNQPEDAEGVDIPQAEVKSESSNAGSQQVLLEKADEGFSVSDIHGNDTKVLSLLNEAGSEYSFKGIMRKLEMHQQSLSRALHRLEEMGLIKRSDGGYRLSPTGESVAAVPNTGSKLQRREYT